MKKLFFVIITAMMFPVCHAQTLSDNYLGQTPPGDTPEIFGKNIISMCNIHSRLVISPDNDEMFWTAFNNGSAQVLYIKKENGKWTSPQKLIQQSAMTTNPFFAPGGKKLFFNYKEETNSNWATKYIEKTDTGWSLPKNDGFLLNTSSSFTKSGKVYYCDYMAGKPWNRGIYCAEFSDSGCVNSHALPEIINSPYIDYTPFISPEEDYLLFSSSRPSPEEDMYLYISLRNNDGTWSTPTRINETINFSGNARFPSISNDGKYLFFCGDDGNIYWAAIDSIKKNFLTGDKSKL